MTDINQTTELGLETRSMIAASGSVLIEHLPDNFEELDEFEMDQFVVNNAWEPFERYGAEELWTMISDLASVLRRFHRTELDLMTLKPSREALTVHS